MVKTTMRPRAAHWRRYSTRKNVSKMSMPLVGWSNRTISVSRRRCDATLRRRRSDTVRRPTRVFRTGSSPRSVIKASICENIKKKRKVLEFTEAWKNNERELAITNTTNFIFSFFKLNYRSSIHGLESMRSLNVGRESWRIKDFFSPLTSHQSIVSPRSAWRYYSAGKWFTLGTRVRCLFRPPFLVQWWFCAWRLETFEFYYF